MRNGRPGSCSTSEPAGSEWRYAGLVPLGQALYLAGRADEARPPLEEARTLPGARGRAMTILALAYLSLVELGAGDVGRAELLARDGLAVADAIGHAATAAAANAHLALGCALMRGTDLHAAVEHLERAADLAGGDGPSYWHAHAVLHLAVARHRTGDALGAQEALSSARGRARPASRRRHARELYFTAGDALHQRRRHEGFLGEELSEAELRVLDRLLAGLSVSHVARELWLSSNTVKTHRRNIYRKLGATTREDLVARAAEAGFVAGEAEEVHPGE